MEKVEGRSRHFCYVLASSHEFKGWSAAFHAPKMGGLYSPARDKGSQMAISTALDSLTEGLGPGLGHIRKAIIKPLFSCSFTFCFKLVSFGGFWRLVEGGRERAAL